MNKHFKKLPGDLVLFAVWNIAFIPFGLFLQIMAGDSGEMPPIIYSPAFYLIVVPNLLFILYFIRKGRAAKLKGANIEDIENDSRSINNPVINFLHRHNLLFIAIVLLNATDAVRILDVRKLFSLKEITVPASLLFETLLPNAIIVGAYLLFYLLYLRKQN
ncbi:hypothetical protein [Priestia aryabhattai]